MNVSMTGKGNNQAQTRPACSQDRIGSSGDPGSIGRRWSRPDSKYVHVLYRNANELDSSEIHFQIHSIRSLFRPAAGLKADSARVVLICPISMGNRLRSFQATAFLVNIRKARQSCLRAATNAG
jgi:hypothetical protein